MSRVRLVVAAAAAIVGVALAGCSGMPDWMTPSMPDWLSPQPSGPQMQSLRFESDPPGADVRTAQGQTCLTPCALAVPSASQAVTITKIGFIPQTVQISTGAPPDHSFWENPPPTLIPNPVQVVLQAVPPPPPPKAIHKRKPRKSVSRTRTAAKSMPPQGGAANPFPDPPPTQPAASPFPPPPSTQQ